MTQGITSGWRQRAWGAALALAMLAASACAPDGEAHGQSGAAPRVGLGFGVDTATPDVGPIVRLVREYLSRPDTTARTRGLWSTTHPLDALHGDLALAFAYQGFPVTVVGVHAAGVGDSVYVVKLLHARGDSAGRVTPLALQRLYALRAPAARHGWQLANALPRETAAWPTLTMGPITFHYAPGQRPDSVRAGRTVQFVDSVARAFGVPAPPRIGYYVTRSPDEYYRALGMDFYVLPSGRGTSTGGNALVAAGIVLSGDAAQAEEYRHEVVHLIVGSRFGGGAILGEGIPTWIAGSKGRDKHALFRLLAEYQRSRPSARLSALVEGEVPSGWTNAETDALYASSALFVEAVHRRGGMPAVRALAGTPGESGALLATMRRALALSTPDALEAWWRSAPTEFGR